MKLKLISAVIAASFLAGCSSSGSSNGGESGPAPQDGVADVIYNEETNSVLIKGDNGNNVVVTGNSEGQALINVNGENFFVTDGNAVINDQEEIVGHVQKEGESLILRLETGDEYRLHVENGRLTVSDVIHSERDPGFDGPDVSDVWYIDTETGELKFNGETVGTVTPTDNVVDGTGTYEVVIGDSGEVKLIQVVNYGGYVEIKVPGKGRLAITIDNGVISRIGWDAPEIDHPIETDPGFGNDRIIKQVDRFERPDGTVIVRVSGFNGGDVEFTTDQHGKIVSIHANEQAKAFFRDKIEGSVGHLPSNDIDRQELKSKLQSLTQEQRQQIKQAVKDRVGRS
ncbi:hypothetical protein L1D26_07265 [Vibrio mediterranei]|uniref:hypothetical protein n=1 Tax=Vibrio mediterranei TaxID=689 RepID=UPI001EFD589A|nr:hypothetical protein [Vibrio mediterranei]MCG9662851.1 hypothetical protein [Vibrio mediterranei]